MAPEMQTINAALPFAMLRHFLKVPSFPPFLKEFCSDKSRAMCVQVNVVRGTHSNTRLIKKLMPMSFSLPFPSGALTCWLLRSPVQTQAQTKVSRADTGTDKHRKAFLICIDA
jgi:hypothetical protein